MPKSYNYAEENHMATYGAETEAEIRSVYKLLVTTHFATILRTEFFENFSEVSFIVSHSSLM